MKIPHGLTCSMYSNLLGLLFLLITPFVLSNANIENGTETMTCQSGDCLLKPNLMDAMAHDDYDIYDTDDGYQGYLWGRYDCKTIFSSPRPLTNTSTWDLLKDTFRTIFKGNETWFNQGSGFKVPVEVRYAPNKGRGVFASEFIPKGELVWSAANNVVMFSDGQSYEEFLDAIPQDLACDVLQWAYVEEYEDEDYICCDLDHGSIINSVYSEDDVLNLGCIQEDHKMVDCTPLLFALEDIEKGDEFLCDYDSFEVEDGMAIFDTRD